MTLAPWRDPVVGPDGEFSPAWKRWFSTVSTSTATWINVKENFGAVGDGIADDTAAINAADAAACAGNLGLDGSTIVAEFAVYFPPGTYRVNSTLTYRGAPWVGSGTACTFINSYAVAGALVNAEGTNARRKILSITDIAFSGLNASGTAYGIRLGYNQRSFRALNRIRLDHFPGPALYLAQPNWNLSFYDVYCSFNANGVGSLGTAIYVDPAVPSGTLNAFDWYNLQLENNGYATSGVGGGIELPNDSASSWHFYGGVWEGNYGAAEARITSALEIHIDGLYVESELGHVTDGLVFNNAFGSLSNAHMAAATGFGGSGIRLRGTSNFVLSQFLSNIKWAFDIRLEDTAIAHLIGEGALNFSIATGAQLRRLSHKRIQLTDAATIATDAAQGNSFYVTLGGNRTMGAPMNPSTGQQITYTVTQDGVGGRTLAWNAVFKVTWAEAGNVAGARSSITYEYDGTNWNPIAAQAAYV